MKRRSFIKTAGAAAAATLTGVQRLFAGDELKPKVTKSDNSWHLVTVTLPGNISFEMRIRGNSNDMRELEIDYVQIIQPREQKEL